MLLRKIAEGITRAKANRCNQAPKESVGAFLFAVPLRSSEEILIARLVGLGLELQKKL